MAREEFVGSSKRDLVFKTAGRISILIGDKYYSLNFSDSSNSNNDSVNDTNNGINNNIIIAESITPYLNGEISYPGDGTIIFTYNKDIYITLNNSYELFKFESSQQEIVKFNKTITFSGNPAFKVSNNNLINGLNAQYLNGKTENNFIQNSDNITLKNLIIDTISSSDGNFYYKNGVFSFNNDKNFISDKINIGKGIYINNIIELDYSKYIPYDNNIFNELLNLENLDLYDLPNLLEPVNSSFTIDISNFNIDNIIDLYTNLYKYIYFKISDSELWNNYIEVKNKYCNINLLKYNKASYRLYVDNTNGINLYDEFSTSITYEEYSNGIITTDNSCNIDESYNKKYTTINVNCCVTYIGKDFICITTDFESNLYKYSSENTYNVNININNNNINIEYKSYNELDNFECYTTKNLNIKELSSSLNFIGDLSGLQYLGKDISGYGIYLNKDIYLINPKIYNEFYIVDNTTEKTIDIISNSNFSLIGNSNVLFSGELINGLTVNIYSNKSCNILTGDNTFSVQENSYNVFKCIPISSNNLKWIKIT